MEEQKNIRNEHLRHDSSSDDPDQVRMHRRMQEEARGHVQDADRNDQQQMSDSDVDTGRSVQTNSMGSGNMQQSRG